MFMCQEVKITGGHLADCLLQWIYAIRDQGFSNYKCPGSQHWWKTLFTQAGNKILINFITVLKFTVEITFQDSQTCSHVIDKRSV